MAQQLSKRDVHVATSLLDETADFLTPGCLDAKAATSARATIPQIEHAHPSVKTVRRVQGH